MLFHLCARIDSQDMLPHYLGLETADGGMIRDDLTVKVRQADPIGVHQHKGTDSCTRQSVRRMAAHTAQAEHCHLCPCQAFHRSRPQQKLGTGKFIQQSLSSLLPKNGRNRLKQDFNIAPHRNMLQILQIQLHFRREHFLNIRFFRITAVLQKIVFILERDA